MELPHLFRFVTIWRLDSIIRMQKKSFKQIFACLRVFLSVSSLCFKVCYVPFHSIPFLRIYRQCVFYFRFCCCCWFTRRFVKMRKLYACMRINKKSHGLCPIHAKRRKKNVYTTTTNMVDSAENVCKSTRLRSKAKKAHSIAEEYT